jgi:SP family sugar:H+ symporter-like MFS transporter
VLTSCVYSNTHLCFQDWLQTFGTQAADGTWEIATKEESLIVSILSAGTFFGALLAAPMGDILGRKWGLILACLVFSVGVALQTGTTGVPVFVGTSVPISSGLLF